MLTKPSLIFAIRCEVGEPSELDSGPAQVPPWTSAPPICATRSPAAHRGPAAVQHDVVCTVHSAATCCQIRLGEITPGRFVRSEHQDHRNGRALQLASTRPSSRRSRRRGVHRESRQVESRPANGPWPCGGHSSSHSSPVTLRGANPVLSVVRMVTTFSENEKIVLRRSTYMRFTFTHPMHSHPYNPELVTGSGIATVAAAAEAAGFHGFGFTDHPAPSQRWLESGGHDAVDPFVAMGYVTARTTTLRLIPSIVVCRTESVRGGQGPVRRWCPLSDGVFTLGVGVGYLKGSSTHREWTSTNGPRCSRKPWR